MEALTTSRSIALSAAQDAALARLAREQQTSISAVVRNALEPLLKRQGTASVTNGQTCEGDRP